MKGLLEWGSSAPLTMLQWRAKTTSLYSGTGLQPTWTQSPFTAKYLRCRPLCQVARAGQLNASRKTGSPTSLVWCSLGAVAPSILFLWKAKNPKSTLFQEHAVAPTSLGTCTRRSRHLSAWPTFAAYMRKSKKLFVPHESLPYKIFIWYLSHRQEPTIGHIGWTFFEDLCLVTWITTVPCTWTTTASSCSSPHTQRSGFFTHH